MQKTSLFLALVFMMPCTLWCFNANAQEKSTPRMSISYTRLNDGTRRIDARLTVVVMEEKIFIENGVLELFLVTEASEDRITTTKSDWEGRAAFLIRKDTALLPGPDGFYSFTVRYAGDARFEGVESSLQVKDVQMDLSLALDDTIRTASAAVYTSSENNARIAVPDVTVEFYVTRLFCLFSIGNAVTDSSGNCSVPFPVDMPGDSIGVLTVVAKILDHDEYATVIRQQEIGWGLPVVPEHHYKRGLGDTDAPLWMVYTLIILLSGVWFHFMYVMFLVRKISRIGKRALKAQPSS